MADRNDNLTPKAQIQAIMDELGLDWEAAALLYMIENGDAFVDDIVFEWSPGREPTGVDNRRRLSAEQPSLAGASNHSEDGAAARSHGGAEQAATPPSPVKRT